MKFLALIAPALISTAAASYSLSSISNVFVFGASYDSTNVPGPTGQDNVSTAWGYNWVIWLTEHILPGAGHFVNRINYAIPGAVTDKTLAPTFNILGFNAGDLVDQVSRFVSNSKSDAPGWTGANSLFFFPGSNTGNDIVNTWNNNGISKVPQFRDQIRAQWKKLYYLGARNVVFWPVLPVDFAPNITAQNGVSQVQNFVNTYQYYLNLLASEIAAMPEVTLFQPNDITAGLRGIAQNPQSNYFTLGYSDTTHYCTGYQTNPCFTPSIDFCHQQFASNYIGNNCPLAISKYLFVDALHITEPAHQYIASIIYGKINQ